MPIPLAISSSGGKTICWCDCHAGKVETHQDPKSLAEEAKVPLGIARRYYRDIKSFAKRRKLDHPAASTQQEHLPVEHGSTQ